MSTILNLIKAIAIVLGLSEPPNMEPVTFDTQGINEGIAPTSFPLD